MSFQNSIQIRSVFAILVATAMFVGGLNTAQAGSSKNKAPTPTFENLHGRPLVSVRYVAFADRNARERLQSRYVNQRQYGSRISSGEFNENAFDDALAKTGYYTAELTQTLKKQIPDADIVMSPLRIMINEAGKLVAVPVTEIREPDACIEFFAYVHPSKSLDVDTTIGRNLMPFASVSSRYLQASSTGGSVMQPDQTYFMNGGTSSCPGLVSITDFLESSDDAYAAGPKAVKTAKKLLKKERSGVPLTEKRPVRANTVLVYKADKTKLGVGKDEFDSKEIFTGYAHVVIDALNNASQEIAATSQLPVDPAYATSVDSNWMNTPDYERRLTVIQKIYSTELRFMQESDVHLIGQTHAAEWGDAFRETRQAELSMVRKAGAARWTGFALAAVAGVKSAEAGIENTNVVLAIAESGETKRRSLATEFANQFEEIRRGQSNFTVEFAGFSESMKIEDLSQLRGLLRNKYNELFSPSLAQAN